MKALHGRKRKGRGRKHLTGNLLTQMTYERKGPRPTNERN